MLKNQKLYIGNLKKPLANTHLIIVYGLKENLNVVKQWKIYKLETV